MAGEFTSSYQRAKYWLDLLWPDREKKQQQQEQADQEHADQEQEQAQQEQRLREEDFEDGFRYEETESGTLLVQQYPTGRYLGELRQTEDGEGWETRHRPDAEWERAEIEADLGDLADDPQAQAKQQRFMAASFLEERHCGQVEADLIGQGIYVDYDAYYSLETLHNAQNAVDKVVDREQVNDYMRHHSDSAAEVNEVTATVEAVPDSTQWNTASPEVRQQIRTTSPWAAEQAQHQQQQVAQYQAQQQVQAAQPAPSAAGVER